MNKKAIGQAVGAAVGTGIVGLVVGYLVFGKVGGHYLKLGTLFSLDANMLKNMFQSATGIDAVRMKVLSCGGIGAVVGVIWRFIPVMKK